MPPEVFPLAENSVAMLKEAGLKPHHQLLPLLMFMHTLLAFSSEFTKTHRHPLLLNPQSGSFAHYLIQNSETMKVKASTIVRTKPGSESRTLQIQLPLCQEIT